MKTRFGVAVFFVSCLLSTHTAFGQLSANTGPGGVGNNVGTSSLVVWLSAENAVYPYDAASPQDRIVRIINKSGYPENAGGSGPGVSPGLVKNALNGFPVARFGYNYIDGNRYITSLDFSPRATFLDLTQWSFFVVTKPNSYKDANVIFSKGTSTLKNYELASTADGSPQFSVSYTNRTNSIDTYPVPMSNTEFKIYQYDYDNLNHVHYTNLTEVFRQANTRTPRLVGNLVIGRDINSNFMDGDIAEFLIYNRKVNLVEQIIVNNYLAAKYGLTLPKASDVYTMDDPANGNYDYDAAGIGQALDGSSQVDSRGSGVVRMVVENTASMTNGEFLVWGHDGTRLNSHYTIDTPEDHLTRGDVDGKIIQERLKRVWRVSKVGDVGTVTVSFDINSLSDPDGSNLRLLIDRDGDGFADNDVTPQGGGTYVNKIITFAGVNFQNGDRFTLANTLLSKPLPIELLSFTAAPEGTAVKLSWSTASELNNDYFVVQHSVDGETWEDVLTEKGAGDKSTRTNYEGTDNRAHLGTSYYRIKQVDRDGKYSYSQIKRVEVAEKLGLKAYPNPVTSGSFHVVTGFEIEAENIQLVDMMGKPLPLKIFKDNEEGVLVETVNPSPGVYVLQVAKGYWKQSMRVVIR